MYQKWLGGDDITMDIKVRDFLKSQKAEVEKNEAVVDPGALAKLEKKRAEPLQTMTAKAFTLMSAMNRALSAVEVLRKLIDYLRTR